MATPKRSALGRGLDALISMDNIVTSGTSSIHEIELSQIVPNPDQPRREFDQEALEELASSIRELGIIQPISLRQVDGGNYQIIAGERRYRAAQMAGLETIPAYVRTVEDETLMEMALIENIQREDLNSIEIALAFQKLIELYQLTQEKLQELLQEEMKNVRSQVADAVDETVHYSMEKTERGLERLTNEKMTAVSEYAQTVLEDIHKNHEEVMFLYDILNNKHENLKETATEVSMAVKEASVKVSELDAARAAEPEIDPDLSLIHI